MCEFHGSNSNGFGDIWWTDNPIYFSSIDISFASRLFRVQVLIRYFRVLGDLIAALLRLFAIGHLNMAAAATVWYSRGLCCIV